ncbi:TetR/AcrR family transcriptional regulator [Glaciibacter flavus]|uniref:TetR/AcrR family transcriptional regulator n=1 Tax=Orlajensenia flava TaxID=2565934 RepID=UPI001A9ABED1|nr:TetR/AcrR family transcriptional regulator [Glaciibacter flavus]
MIHPQPPSAQGPRGAYAKTAARRREIVEVATGLFAREGYRSVTMLQVANACGVSRTGLLHHFPTKESLLEEVLHAREETDAHRLDHLDRSRIDAVTALADLVALIEHNTTIPAIINLYAVLSAEAADPTHPAHAYFVERYAGYSRALTADFERARADGTLAAGVDPARFAVELIALMDGLQVQWLLDPRIDMVGMVRGRIQSALTVPLPRA